MISKYDIEYMGVKCTEVEWNEPIYTIFHFVKDGKTYHFTPRKHYDCCADTDHIRCVIEEEFLPWWEDERLKQLEAENAELKARLEKAVELPVSVDDLVYDISDVEVQELKVRYINIEVFDVGKSWMISCAQEAKEDFVKLLGDFYGIMWFTTEAEAEARLAELRGANAD